MNKLCFLFLVCFSFKPLDGNVVVSMFRKTIEQSIIAPFQGRRTFCSIDKRSKVVITIHGNKAIIISDKKKIRGVFKKYQFFSDDPDEIAYRKVAGKYNYGKYYVINTSYFSVLNAENGEYSYYKLCEK